MPKVSPIQSSFNAGEMSPLLYGRVDTDRYKTGLATCKNYIPTIQGGTVRRPGSYYAAEVKYSAKQTRLAPFEFSTTQAYMLEFGDSYIRFYKDHGLITLTPVAITNATAATPVVVTAASHGYSNGDRVVITGIFGMTQLNNREFAVANVATNSFELQDSQTGLNLNGTAFTAYASGGAVAKIYEIASPYDADAINLLTVKHTQSADVFYLAHPTYAPRKLTRTGHTAWTITAIDILDGPYLATNTTTTTLTPGASTGTGISLTASAIVGINGGAGFATTDVGRLIRIKEGSVWGYVKITAWVSTTVVTVTIVNTLTNTNAKLSWRMGLYSDTTGYPTCVTFHEDRLVFAGAAAAPQRFDASRSSDYENFSPTDTDGTVTSSHSLGFSLNANDVNVIRWLSSDERGVLIGTVGGEWVVKPASNEAGLTPTNINAKRSTSYGSADLQPVQVGKSTLFIQRSGKKLREMSYFFDVDGFRASDLTVLSEHITGNGVIQIAYQKEPQSIVWGVREDGVLIGMTYERDVDSFKVGWARQIIGGISDAASSSAVVESVAVIPSPDGSRDEAWIVVQRRINGATHRYVEYLTTIYNDLMDQQDAICLDAASTYDSPVTMTGATAASPVVVTAASHGFSNGDQIRITGVLGMTTLNGPTYLVANKTAGTFQLANLSGTLIDGSAYAAYVSGGEVRKLISTISGLNHLEGESVAIYADGAKLPNATITKGVLTLSNPSAVVQIGYSYSSDGQLLRLDAGSADGTALGKTRRTHRVGMLLHKTEGLKIGMSFDELDEYIFRTSADEGNRAVPLFSGIISETVTADYDFENQFCWRQDGPFPGMILAVMPQMMTQDR